MTKLSAGQEEKPDIRRRHIVERMTAGALHLYRLLDPVRFHEMRQEVAA